MSERPTGESGDARLRAAICAAGRRLGSRGLISAGEGNLSLRLGDGRLLTTPTGRRKDELVPDDLSIVPFDVSTGPDPSGPPPSSDIAIHRAIYRARPDVVAVAHAHLPASMALTLAGEIPDPAALPETAYHVPVLPFVASGAMGSEELAGRVAEAFGATGPSPVAVVLERHGAIAIGSAGSAPVGGAPGAVDPAGLEAALLAAVDRLELVEVLCRTIRDAILLKAARDRSV